MANRWCCWGTTARPAEKRSAAMAAMPWCLTRAGDGEDRRDGGDAAGAAYEGGPGAAAADDAGYEDGAGDLPRAVAEHRDHHPRTGGAHDRGQVGDDEEDRGQHGDRAGQDAEYARVDKRLAALAQAQPRGVSGASSHTARADSTARTTSTHIAARQPQAWPTRMPKGKAGDDRDRAAAGHDGQRPGTTGVVAEDAGRRRWPGRRRHRARRAPGRRRRRRNPARWPARSFRPRRRPCPPATSAAGPRRRPPRR